MKKIVALFAGVCLFVAMGTNVCFGYGRTIFDVKDFLFFAREVENGNNFCGETIVLENDIDLTYYMIMPIGTKASPFCGNFYGNSHSIILNMRLPFNKSVGLFGVTRFAQFKDLDIRGTVEGGGKVGGFVGECYDTEFYGCRNLANVNGFSKVGGFVGRGYNCNFENCLNVGLVSSGERCGEKIFFGSLEGKCRFLDCNDAD